MEHELHEKGDTSNPKNTGVRGGFVCDEMGLGKTILMLGAIAVNTEATRQRTLIVLPYSLLQQWIGVFEKFMGHSPLLYHGNNVKQTTEEELASAPIVVTTYGMIANRKNPIDYESPLWKFTWGRVIFDEAHHMRNEKTNQFKGALKLKSGIKWLVTGTPINNTHMDFCHLCQILGLSPNQFSSMEALKKTILDYVIKRTKESVGIKMPKLDIEIVEAPFVDREEETLVRNIHSYMNFANVTANNVDDIIDTLSEHKLPMLMRCRQGCVYPELVLRALRKKIAEFNLLADDYPVVNLKSHSKITAVTEKIKENKTNGKKKLVFCHYIQEIEKINDILMKSGMHCAVMTGSTPKKAREAALEDGNHSPDVLIVQIQTACEGLNLQHFSEIYFTTPHWNPAVEDQAIARAHRIGQTEEVKVYRFVSKFTNIDGDGDNYFEGVITLDEYCLIVQEKKRETMKMIQ